jgi:hypothetical protein
MVCIVIRLGLPELNAEELANYLSSIENDQPIYSLTGLNAQEIAEEVDLFFKNDQVSEWLQFIFNCLYSRMVITQPSAESDYSAQCAFVALE